MKKILVLALVTALVGGAALAVWNAQDVVPAATLLVPYAIVSASTTGNTTDATGWTTMFSITNVSSQAQIVHITVWSARSAAVVDWDVLLTGYDVWTINFRDCLDGNFFKFDTGPGAFAGPAAGGYSLTPAAWGPVTNNAGNTYYPLAVAGNWASLAAAGCSGAPPYGTLPAVGDMIRTKLRAGQAAAGDQSYWCADPASVLDNTTTLGELTATDPFFFYVTADVVTTCTRLFPNDAGYWSPNIINADNNVIVGDILYINEMAHYSEMLNAVHLEAYTPYLNMPANYIGFYELDLVTAGAAIPDLGDTREPLGTQYAFRYATSPSPYQSNVIVWKNVNDLFGAPEVVDGCRSYRYWAWNEDELTKSHTSGAVSGGDSPVEPCALCFETQKVPVSPKNFYGLVQIASGGANTGTRGAAGFGWVWIDFWSADKSQAAGRGSRINDYEAYVAVEFVFGNYATAAAAPLLWTPYNRAEIRVPVNTVIPTQNAYVKNRAN